MTTAGPNDLHPVGLVHSTLVRRADAPKQGRDGAPDAEVEVLAEYAPGLSIGQDIWLLTWLHEAGRAVLEVRPRRDPAQPLTGVFATRSPDRPNPIGLHRVRLLGIRDGRWLTVAGLEAIDGTPVIDIKPVIEDSRDA